MKENRKSQIGRVVGDKMDKTVVVKVESHHTHPLYRRIVRTSRKFKAHDERNESHLGDLVRIEEARALSREKRWRVAQILERRQVAEIQPRDVGVPEGER